jgi:carbonic anhydrase
MFIDCIKMNLISIVDLDKRYDRLVELNVQEQCVNLIKTAAVQQAYKEEVYKLWLGI